MTDTVVRNGRVVTADGIRHADIAIADGKIARVGCDLAKGGAEIDASGLLVLPGIVDAHTHPVYLDNLASLPVTGAYGGVTTVIHYAYAKPGEGLMETIRRFREEAEGVSVLDFALHGGLFDPAHQSHEIPLALEAGVTSHKMFMTYAKLGWMTDDYQLMRTLDILGQSGGMGMVHAENGLATDYLQDKTSKAGDDPIDAFRWNRSSDSWRAEAIKPCHCHGCWLPVCPLYIPAHDGTGFGVDVVARARAARPIEFTSRRVRNTLTLTGEALKTQGPLIKIGPPLRSKDDRSALWRALASGIIDTVASDHAAKAKTRADDFFAAPYGSPQIESMLSLVYDGGVNGGWLSLPRLVRVMCENPARIFGLYPQKGTLCEGSDADLVLFDPSKRQTVTHATQHSEASYTAYEGRKILGKPVLTMQRGEILVEQGELTARPGRGRFLRTNSGNTPLGDLTRKA